MGFPGDLIWLAVPAYLILQFVVIWRSSGPEPEAEGSGHATGEERGNRTGTHGSFPGVRLD